MKFKITMKDPDGVGDAIKEAADKSTREIDGLDDEEEFENVRDHRQEQFSEIVGEWFQYGEYLTVEIDTEAKTCTVVKQ